MDKKEVYIIFSKEMGGWYLGGQGKFSLDFMFSNIKQPKIYTKLAAARAAIRYKNLNKHIKDLTIQRYELSYKGEVE